MKFNPGPLFDAIPFSATQVAKMAGVRREQIVKWQEADGVGDHLDGLTAGTADLLCIKVLGLHPIQVYGDEWRMQECNMCGGTLPYDEFPTGARRCYRCDRAYQAGRRKHD